LNFMEVVMYSPWNDTDLLWVDLHIKASTHCMCFSRPCLSIS
jgi:hypothetical protein